MLNLIQDLGSRLQSLGAGAYWVIFLIVFLETFIVVGQFIPGSIVLAFVGFLCYLQVYDFGDMLFGIFLGHYLGEFTNYWLGLTKGRSLFSEESRFLKPRLLDMAERRLAGGGLRIFIFAQFTGVIRPFVSFAAGATRYPLWKFAINMGIAGFLWSIAPLGLGFLLGESWQNAVQYFEGLSVLVLVLIPTVFLTGWLIREIAHHAGVMGSWLEQVSRRAHRSPRYARIARTSPRLFNFLEARLSLSKRWGIGATMGFFLATVLFALFVGILHNVRSTIYWREVDASLVNLLLQLRRPAAENFFLFFMNMGSAPVLISMAVLACVFCLLSRQFQNFATIVGAIAISLLISRFTSFMYTRKPPDAIFGVLEIYRAGFPGSHASLAVAVLGSLYYWLWNHPGRVRLRMALASVFLASLFLISFARLYLGILFPSEVVAGYCLGFSAVVAAGTIARNVRWVTDVQRRTDIAALVVVLCGVLLAAAAGKKSPAPREVQITELTNHGTLSDAIAALPRAGKSLGGRLRIPVNIVLLRDPTDIVEKLRERGWKQVKPDAFFTREIEAPLFPVFLEGVPAHLTLEKPQGKGRLVLRFWPTSHDLKDKAIWLGSGIAEERRPRLWKLKTYQVMPDVDAALAQIAVDVSPSPEPLPRFRRRDLYLWKFPHFTHGMAILVR